MEYRPIPESILDFVRQKDGTYYVCLKHRNTINHSNDRAQIESLGQIIKDNLPEYGIILSMYGDKKVSWVGGFGHVHENGVATLEAYDDYIGRSYVYDTCNPYPALRGIALEDGIEKIEFEAFKGCKDLVEFRFPSTLKRLGADAFDETSVDFGNLPEGLVRFELNHNAVTRHLRFGPHLAELEKFRFLCDSIEIDPENPNYDIEGGVFYDKRSKTALSLSDRNHADIVIRDGTKEIGPYAFHDEVNLKSIVVPGSVRKIGRSGICFCKNLSSITLNEGLEELGDCALYNNEQVRELILPKSLKKAPYYSCCASKECVVKCRAKERPEGFAYDFAERSKEVIFGYED